MKDERVPEKSLAECHRGCIQSGKDVYETVIVDGYYVDLDVGMIAGLNCVLTALVTLRALMVGKVKADFLERVIICLAHSVAPAGDSRVLCLLTTVLGGIQGLLTKQSKMEYDPDVDQFRIKDVTVNRKRECPLTDSPKIDGGGIFGESE